MYYIYNYNMSQSLRSFVSSHRLQLLGVLALACLLGAGGLHMYGPFAVNPVVYTYEYPHGATPNGIEFEALNADDARSKKAQLLDTPGIYWSSYEFTQTRTYEDENTPRYTSGHTGIVAVSSLETHVEVWNERVANHSSPYMHRYTSADDRVVRYPQYSAFVAENRVSNDPNYYNETTDTAYWHMSDGYDGTVIWANLYAGDAQNRVDDASWKAVGTTTHHGVPAITYRATGVNPDNDRLTLRDTATVEGTLTIDAEHGTILAYSVTYTDEERRAIEHFSYTVAPTDADARPAWVDTIAETR